MTTSWVKQSDTHPKAITPRWRCDFTVAIENPLSTGWIGHRWVFQIPADKVYVRGPKCSCRLRYLFFFSDHTKTEEACSILFVSSSICSHSPRPCRATSKWIRTRDDSRTDNFWSFVFLSLALRTIYRFEWSDWLITRLSSGDYRGNVQKSGSGYGSLIFLKFIWLWADIPPLHREKYLKPVHLDAFCRLIRHSGDLYDAHPHKNKKWYAQ